jgi:hypothetical protein
MALRPGEDSFGPPFRPHRVFAPSDRDLIIRDGESQVGIPVLLVATTTTWFGTARIPRVLAEAGFKVSLLTPRHSLAEASRFVSKIGYLVDHATSMQWFEEFAAMVKATSPRLVIPCDDMAFRLLASVVIAPPRGVRADLQLQLAALVRDSLGDPAYYRMSVDKTLLPPLAETLGVLVPPYTIITDLAGAEDFVARHKYPVVLKRGHGFAGQGVAICENYGELARAFAAFAVANAKEIRETAGDCYLLQAHVTGSVQYFHALAWQGELTAGWALEKLVANPAPTGPPTVTRYFSGTKLRVASALADCSSPSSSWTPQPARLICSRSIVVSVPRCIGARCGTSICALRSSARSKALPRSHARHSTLRMRAPSCTFHRSGCAIRGAHICANTRQTCRGTSRN